MAESTFTAYLATTDTSSESSPTHTPTSRQSSFCDHEVGLAVHQPTHTRRMHTPDPAQYILVIGGLGYVGSHTAWELLRDGHNVVIIDNLSNSHIEVVYTLEQMCDELFAGTGKYRPRIDFHDADVRDKANIQKILKSYVVPKTSPLQSSIFAAVHFAAHKSVPESLRHPLQYYDNNVSGLISICNMLSLFNIKRLVFSSSAAVYGSVANELGRLEEERCVHETTRWRDASGEERITQSGCRGLTNPYGRSKWMCEAILSDLALSDPDWAIVMLRYFNPVGCDESGLLGENPCALPTNLVPVLLEVVKGDTPCLRVFGNDWDTPDGTAIRDFIHVSDLARGHLNALQTARLQGLRTYNLGTGRGHSVLEVVQAMEEVSGRKVPLVQAGRREGDVGICVAEPTKAENELGWKTQKTLMHSCRDLCRFLNIPVTESVATEHDDGMDCGVKAP